MLELLKRLYAKTEELKGKRLLVVLLFTFTSFTIIGIIAGYFIDVKLNKNEITTNQDKPITQTEVRKSYEGKVVYINPELYPLDRVSYSLNDSTGKVIYLLRVNDQKLALAENLNVKLYGTLSKTQDGKIDVIDVSEVVIKNASN
jgi:hypothetical protein